MATVLILTCKNCGRQFKFKPRSGPGRMPYMCSEPCRVEAKNKALARYRQSESYRTSQRKSWAKQKEIYDPWMWENTILDWNE